MSTGTRVLLAVLAAYVIGDLSGGDLGVQRWWATMAGIGGLAFALGNLERRFFG